MTDLEKNTPVLPLIVGKEQKNAPVAVFDSGAGGIAVLRAIRKALPHEELLYFGDSANAPYGERSFEEILHLTLSHAARLLISAKALVLACNTATAVAASTLRRRYPDIPIIGMEPALKPALATAEHPRILVLATPVTLREGKFAALLDRYGKEGTILPVPAPELVRLVEGGEENSPRMAAYLEKLLFPLQKDGIDAVVLGCTHFCFAADVISHTVGQNVPLFDGVQGTVKQLERRLAALGLRSERVERANVTMTSSDSRALPLFAKLLFEN